MAGKSCLLSLTLIVMFIFASAHRPLVEYAPSEAMAKMDGNPNTKSAGSPRPPADWKMGAYENEKVTPDDDDDDDDDAIGPMAVPVYPVPTPGTADGGFHFNLGPIGFGGDVQIGLIPGGGFVVPFSRPYVVVPQYSGPGSPEPYPYGFGSPHQQPGSGNGQPQQGYYGNFYPEHD